MGASPMVDMVVARGQVDFAAPRVKPYLLALIWTAIAAIPTLAVSRIEQQEIFLFFTAAVALSALWGNWKSGAFSAILSAAAVAWVLPPNGDFRIEGRGNVIHFIYFCVTVVIVCGISAALHREQSKSLRNSRELQVASARVEVLQSWGKLCTIDFDLASKMVNWSTPSALFSTSLEDWLRRVHPDDRELVRQQLQQASKAPQEELAYRFLEREGYQPVNARLRIVYGSDQQPVRLVGAYTGPKKTA